MRRFGFLLAILLALTACQQVALVEPAPEPVPEPAPEVPAMHTINVTAGFSSGTKTALVPTATGYSFEWTAGDHIRVWQIANGGDMVSDDAILENGGGTASFPVNFPTLSSQPLQYFAIYPYYSDISEVYKDFNGVERFRIQIATEQTLVDGSFDPNTDLLVSKVVDKEEQPESLDLQFARVGSILKMNLVNLAKSLSIDNIRLTADTPIAGYVDFDPESGSYHLDVGKSEERDRGQYPIPSPLIQLGGNQVSADVDGNATVYFRTFPAEIREFTVEVTQGGRSPVFRFRRVNIAAHGREVPIQLVDGKMTEVSVTFGDPIPVESVEIAEKATLASQGMVVGKKYQLNANLTPLEASTEVGWESSDQSVATVDHFGLVTTRCNGTVILTCNAGGMSDSVTVTVVAAEPETVDLGLPSGTLWGSCNLGAISPTGYGVYFAWGDPVAQTTGRKADYVFWRNTDHHEDYLAALMGKYTFDGAYAPGGVPDCKQFLDPADDPATVFLGSEWRSPTKAEVTELFANCTTSREIIDQVNCIRFTSRINGNSIVLPLSGWAYNNDINNRGELVHLWTGENIPQWSWPYSQLVEHTGGTDVTQTNKVTWSNGERSTYLSISTGNVWASSWTIDASGYSVALSQKYVERYYYKYCIRPVKMPAAEPTVPDLHIVSVDPVTATSARVTLQLKELESSQHTYKAIVAQAGGSSYSEVNLADVTRNGRTIIGTLSGLTEGTEYSVYVIYRLPSSSPVCSDNRVRFTARAGDPSRLLTDFSVSPAEVVLNVGQASQIIPALTPSTAVATVTYESSDSDVATVSASGLITAVGAGTAQIECTATGLDTVLKRYVSVTVEEDTPGPTYAIGNVVPTPLASSCHINALVTADMGADFSRLGAYVYYSATAPSSLDGLINGRTTRQVEAAIGRDGKMSADLTGLSPSTKYYFCVKLSGLDQNVCSDLKHFTTKAEGEGQEHGVNPGGTVGDDGEMENGN